MTLTIMQTLLRQRLSSPLRLLFLAVVSLVSIGAVAVTGSLTPFSQLGPTLAAIFAAGLIGQEMSSGTLQLALARPITRRRYVLSRWLGAVASVALVALVLLGISLLLMMRSGPLPSFASIAVAYAQLVLDAAATAALLTAFSALLGGLGDLAILLLLYTLLPLLGQVAGPLGWTTVTRTLAIVQPMLAPHFALGFLQGMGTVSWAGLANATGVLVLGLGIAIAVLNRRELSYGNH